MELHAYRSNARGLPGCTWRLQKPTERAWARLALSIKRRNPGWRNIFLCGSVVCLPGSLLPCLVSSFPPSCHLVPLHNRSSVQLVSMPANTQINWIFRYCTFPFAFSLFLFYFPSLLFNGRNTSNYLSGVDVSVVLQGSTTRYREHSIPPAFYVRTLPRGF